MLVKLQQPANAPNSMLVILFGISILVKPVQFLNALLPIVFTLLPIIISVKFDRLEQISLGICSTDSPNVNDVIFEHPRNIDSNKL